MRVTKRVIGCSKTTFVLDYLRTARYLNENKNGSGESIAVKDAVLEAVFS